MTKLKTLLLFLIMTVILSAQWIKLGIRSEISGTLYIDNRKIKDISVGEIYNGRYKNGRYILTLRNSEAIYQKEIELDSTTEVFYKITRADLLKMLVPEKPRVVIVEKIVEKPVIVEREKVIEKVVEKPVVIEEKVEKKIEGVTFENFDETVLERLENGTAYDIDLKMEKYSILEDEKTKNYLYLVDSENKKYRVDAYDLRRSMKTTDYPSDYAVISLEYSLNFKSDFYQNLKVFYSSLGRKKTEDVNIQELRNTNYESNYIIFANNKRVMKSKVVDDIVEVNHIELRSAKKYIDAIAKFEDIRPKFDLLDSQGKVLINSNLERYKSEIVNADYNGRDLSYKTNMSGIYRNNSYSNKTLAILQNYGVVRNRVLIVLPTKDVEKIQKIRVRSIF